MAPGNDGPTPPDGDALEIPSAIPAQLFPSYERLVIPAPETPDADVPVIPGTDAAMVPYDDPASRWHLVALLGILNAPPPPLQATYLNGPVILPPMLPSWVYCQRSPRLLDWVSYWWSRDAVNPVRPQPKSKVRPRAKQQIQPRAIKQILLQTMTLQPLVVVFQRLMTTFRPLVKILHPMAMALRIISMNCSPQEGCLHYHAVYPTLVHVGASFQRQ